MESHKKWGKYQFLNMSTPRLSGLKERSSLRFSLNSVILRLGLMLILLETVLLLRLCSSRAFMFYLLELSIWMPT